MLILQGLQLVDVATTYFYRMYKQMRFVEKNIEPMLLKLFPQYGLSISPYQSLKLFRNYTLYAVCLNAENICLVKGTTISDTERKRISLMSIMASLCDDLIDEHGFTSNDLMDLLNYTLPPQRQTPLVKLIQHINQEFLKLQPIADSYFANLENAFTAQANSLKQQQKSSIETIIDLTTQKAATSNVLIGYLLNNDLSEYELLYLKLMGIIGQYTNDLFDIYKDFQQGIYTMPNSVTSYQQMEEILNNNFAELYFSVKQFNLSQSQSKRLWNLSVCLMAFANLAMENIKRVAEEFGNHPASWKNIPRHKLIVDMEKIPTCWRFLICYLKAMKYQP